MTRLGMDEKIQDFFQWLAEHLLRGEMDWLDDVYVYPMSLFIGDKIHLEKSSADTRAYLTMRREHAANMGVYAMTAQVSQVTHNPKGSRFSARVHYIFLREDGSEIARNSAHYRCHFAGDDRIKVESLEILEMGLPMPTDAPLVLRH